MRCGRELVVPKPVRLTSSALLAALRRTGTPHLYADTADRKELRQMFAVAGGDILAEIDGNTVNKPLARRVLDDTSRATDLPRARRRSAGVRAVRPAAPLPFSLYTMVSGWIGNDIASSFAGGCAWEVSLQLHMGALSDPATAKALGRALRAIIPSCFVKVPFRPHEPQSLLIARDLEAEGFR